MRLIINVCAWLPVRAEAGGDLQHQALLVGGLYNGRSDLAGTRTERAIQAIKSDTDSGL